MDRLLSPAEAPFLPEDHLLSLQVPLALLNHLAALEALPRPLELPVCVVVPLMEVLPPSQPVPLAHPDHLEALFLLVDPLLDPRDLLEALPLPEDPLLSLLVPLDLLNHLEALAALLPPPKLLEFAVPLDHLPLLLAALVPLKDLLEPPLVLPELPKDLLVLLLLKDLPAPLRDPPELLASVVPLPPELDHLSQLVAALPSQLEPRDLLLDRPVAAAPSRPLSKAAGSTFFHFRLSN